MTPKQQARLVRRRFRALLPFMDGHGVVRAPSLSVKGRTYVVRCIRRCDRITHECECASLRPCTHLLLYETTFGPLDGTAPGELVFEAADAVRTPSLPLLGSQA